MTRRLELVLSCDTDDCPATLIVGPIPPDAWDGYGHQVAANVGWDVGELDHCPDHHPWLP